MGKSKGDYEAVLKVLSEGSQKSDEFLAILKMNLPPNLEIAVSGGEVFWDNLAESNGWKLQQHTMANNVRIIDNKNVRRAFSLDSSRLLGVMDNLVGKLHEHDEGTVSSSGNDSRAKDLATLKVLSQMRDKGAITDEEYEEKKKEILKRI